MPFDLTTEPWIPVFTIDGHREDLSLKATLTRAHEIAALASDTPTVNFALLRLLLAIVHRATLGPVDEDQWLDLWEADTLPCESIETYLTTWAHRFDLTHPTEPFYQVSELTFAGGSQASLLKLIPDLPDNIQYGTNRRFEALARIPLAEAARYVVHCQAFDLAGGKSAVVGSTHKRAPHNGMVSLSEAGWSLRSTPMWLVGQNLRETLVLNLAIYDDDPSRDLPAWERPHATVAHTKDTITGPVDLMTFQARRIDLDVDGDYVTSAKVVYGDIAKSEIKAANDPMARLSWPRKPDKDAAWGPVSSGSSAPGWRGLRSLVLATDHTGRRHRKPRVLEQALRTSRFADGISIRIASAALHTDKNCAKVLDSSQEMIEVHSSILDDPALGELVASAAALGDRAAFSYSIACANLATAGGATSPDSASGTSERARRDAEAALAPIFNQWVASLGSDSTSDAATEWAQAVRRCLLYELWPREYEKAPDQAIAGTRVEDDRTKTLRWYTASGAKAQLSKALAVQTTTPNDEEGDPINEPE